MQVKHKFLKILKNFKELFWEQIFIKFRFYELPPETFIWTLYYKAPKNIFYRLKLVFNFLWKYKREKYFDLYATERLIEWPITFMLLGDAPAESKILDLGHRGSYLSLELASLGYKVTGVDLRDYQFKHPNLTSLKGDFTELKLPSESFDAVIAVSTIEHIGKSVYGSNVYTDGDARTTEKIFTILKVQGIFIMSVPFGKYEETNNYRVYDEHSLNLLLKNFKIESALYFKRKENTIWRPCDKESLEQSSAVSFCGVNGIVVLKARKLL